MREHGVEEASPAGFFRARKYWPGQESEYKETFTALLQRGVSATEAQQQASLKAQALYWKAKEETQLPRHEREGESASSSTTAKVSWRTRPAWLHNPSSGRKPNLPSF